MLAMIDTTKSKFLMVTEPGELNRLGRFYYDKENYTKAIECFDEIIEKFPQF